MALLNLVYWVLGLWFGILVHELGHFVCARTIGLRVRLVSVGAGPLLARRQIAGVTFKFRLLPVYGHVETDSWDYFPRRSATLFILGGILGNAALIFLLGCLDALPMTGDVFHNILTSLASTQYLLIASSLFPYSIGFGGAPLESDGLQLLRLWFPPRGTRRYRQERSVKSYPPRSGSTRHWRGD